MKCIKTAESSVQYSHSGVVYFWEEGLLMGTWKPQHKLRWQELQQIVFPFSYRQQVLKLAHEIFHNLHTTLSSVGFEIRQWASNDTKVICELPHEARSEQTELWLSHHPSLDPLESTQGLLWNSPSLWQDPTFFPKNSYPFHDLNYVQLSLELSYLVSSKQSSPSISDRLLCGLTL